MSHHILMGDPSYFSIKRGANPHTRNRWGCRKKVDLPKAIDQWHRMKETLEQYDVKVHVVPPDPDLPGLVFPANAGVRINDRYLMASLNPARAAEQDIYKKVIQDLGLPIDFVNHQFEGEADLIRWGDQFILTHGRIEKQRFIFNPGLPPWKKKYGFRTDIEVLEELTQWIPREKIIPVELQLEEFYHGDTIFCTFGVHREYLLAYQGGIKKEPVGVFNKNVIWIAKEEAFAFAANSFQIIYQEEPILFMPRGSAKNCRVQIAKRGVQIVELDVSEFFEKGGGSVKCMIGDLGVMP